MKNVTPTPHRVGRFARTSRLATFTLFLILFATFSGPHFLSIANAQAQTVSPPHQFHLAPTKADVLKRLRALQTRQIGELKNLDSAVRKRIQETTTVTLGANDPRPADRQIRRLGESLDELMARRNEATARREFIDSLIFSVDSKWTNQPLSQFLEHRLLDMAVADMSAPHGDGRLWKFMTYLSIAIRETSDPREQALDIVESYMNFATVLNPKSPAEFIASRSYTNGSLSYTAKQGKIETLGDEADRRLNELKNLSTPKMPTPDGTIRTTAKDAVAPKLEIRIEQPAPNVGFDEPAADREL